MATWDEMAARFPASERARSDLGRMPVAHLATVARDGAPRIHPVCPHIALGRLFVAVGAESPKRFDLRDRGRYALHLINTDDPGPAFDEFEFSLTGTSRLVPDAEEAIWAAVRDVCPYPIPDEDWLFELDVEAALTAAWDPIGTPGRRAHRLVWRAGWDAPRAPSNEQRV